MPDHHAGIPVKNATTLFHACGIVTVKKFTIPFHICMKKSDTCCQMPDHHSGTPERNSISVLHACGIVSVKNDTIFCTTVFTASRNHSHFVYSNTRVATIAAITAITGFAAITPNSAVKAPFSFPIILVIVVKVFILENSPVIADIPVATFPTIINNGPIAATISAIVATTFFCPSLIPLSFSTNP